MSTRRLTCRPASVSSYSQSDGTRHIQLRRAVPAETVFDQQITDHLRRPRGRELPVRSKLLGVDRDIVGVSFYADQVPAFRQNASNFFECAQSAFASVWRSAVKETNFSKADDQSVGFHAQGNFVAGRFPWSIVVRVPGAVSRCQRWGRLRHGPATQSPAARWTVFAAVVLLEPARVTRRSSMAGWLPLQGKLQVAERQPESR